jgi:hypothetical protein
MNNNLLKEFFLDDSKAVDINGRKKSSNYLAIKRDLQTIMIKDGKNNLGLSLLTNTTLICTCIDLLAKISVASKPKEGDNGKVFRNYLITYCDFHKEEAEATWKLRNTILHSFTLDSSKGLILFGTKCPVQIINTGERKEITFNVRRLYTSAVIKSAQRLREDISKDLSRKKHSVEYLEKNGFHYKR